MEEKPKWKKYNNEFKESAIKLSHEHPHGVAGAAADLGIVEPMLHRWRRAKRRQAGNRPAFPGNGYVRDAELAEWKLKSFTVDNAVTQHWSTKHRCSMSWPIGPGKLNCLFTKSGMVYISIENNKALVRRWQYDVLNARNFNLLDEVIHPDYVIHDANIHGRDAARAIYQGWTSTPAESISILDMFGEGDTVVSRWVIQGGEKSWKGISIFRIADGKIIEDWFCSEEIKAD